MLHDCCRLRMHSTFALIVILCSFTSCIGVRSASTISNVAEVERTEYFETSHCSKCEADNIDSTGIGSQCNNSAFIRASSNASNLFGEFRTYGRTHKNGKQEEQGREERQLEFEQKSLQDGTTQQHYIQQECGIYLAPSTIPGAGLGMFAGHAYHEEETVTLGDILIPVSDLDWHNGFELDFFLWEEYTWEGEGFPRVTEDVGDMSVQLCSPGIGAAINCILPLVNVEDESLSMDYAGLHMRNDPGSGAFTAIHDRKSYATRDIAAGEELFINYGEHYFESREETYGLIPLSINYEEADDLLSKYNAMIESLQNGRRKQKKQKRRKPFSRNLLKDLYSIVRDFPFESRTLNALPESYKDIEYALSEGTAMQHYNRSVVSIDWLNENGQCMDNVYPGRSTIKQAGRGAFASRFIPKGALVSPAPLIHIKDKQELLMYDEFPEDEDGMIDRNISSPNHYQMLLNYCFGHPDSTLLLSPYGMFSSLINHAPLSSEKANTKIVWSKTMRSPEWKNQTIDNWVYNQHSGLSLDFIAIRDIEPDEEIFIDYGIQWDIAWEHHVRNWDPPMSHHPPSRPYVSALELESDTDLRVKTLLDDHETYYSENIRIYIHEDYRIMSGLEPRDNRGSNYHRCRPISRFNPTNEKDEPLYLVEIVLRKTKNPKQVCYEKVVDLVFNVPRDAFLFRDKSSIREQFSTWSFRHEMMIPDEIFPEAWKNNK